MKWGLENILSSHKLYSRIIGVPLPELCDSPLWKLLSKIHTRVGASEQRMN